MDTNKINVQLYGGTGFFDKRETPLEADIIFCDKASNCSFYKNNRCLNCRFFLSPDCIYGRVNTVKGYTSRARKYHAFKTQYNTDECYNKLSYPNEIVGLIDDMLYMNLSYINVRKDETQSNSGNYIFSESMYGKAFVPVADCTPDFLHRLFTMKPRGLTGTVIARYNNEIVPEILQGLKRLVPDVYQAFIQKYPEFIFEDNYIGKVAKLNTLNGDIDIEIKGKTWHLSKDKKTIWADNVHITTASPWWLRGNNDVAKRVELDVNDAMTVTITDNNQVNSSTVFE